MEEPEVQSRDRIVIARRAQIQESQHLLVHEVEPQKAVVFAGHAAHREVEIGRVAQRRQHVPGRGDQQHDGEAAPGVQTPPHLARKQLPREQQIDYRRAYGEDQGYRAFEQQANPEAGGQQKCPPARMGLLVVKHAQEGPHGERNGSGQHHVGNQDARKQPQSDAGGDRQARIKAGAPAERPDAESRGQPRQAYTGYRYGNAGRPVEGAEDPVRNGNQPINQRRFFEIDHAIEARRDPIPRRQHIACDLRLHGVDIVHERRRGKNTAQIDGRGDQRHG